MENYTPPAGMAVAKGKGKGKGKKKDPNAPKRGQSSFMVFSNAVRSKVKADNPDATFGDLVSCTGWFLRMHYLLSLTRSLLCNCCIKQGKLIGAKFKALSSEEREKYDELAKKEKQRYEKEMAAYEAKKKSEQNDSDGMDDHVSDDSDSD
jgi:structure-specific recognition protein 1